MSRDRAPGKLAHSACLQSVEGIEKTEMRAYYGESFHKQFSSPRSPQAPTTPELIARSAVLAGVLQLRSELGSYDVVDHYPVL